MVTVPGENTPLTSLSALAEQRDVRELPSEEISPDEDASHPGVADANAGTTFAQLERPSVFIQSEVAQRVLVYKERAIIADSCRITVPPSRNVYQGFLPEISTLFLPMAIDENGYLRIADAQYAAACGSGTVKLAYSERRLHVNVSSGLVVLPM
ncbi:hypothetical protein M427DRAFT_492622 [Gonapodya prolifera JEL478]|uniref:Uncharacterized protein n=1 Tax=Gonapodya prolifera (strain JEL478) TaxID=1344416 RepID=A0A138ZX54_GONPJ|nr:hypothetical protein M427DRAFT_492622 [Gonapodya prolifera JEL478]|eukprot:KXS09031.1 hypothetical protein M427DRAFT_492622 [Gonapodya prolifera JEL478]